MSEINRIPGVPVWLKVVGFRRSVNNGGLSLLEGHPCTKADAASFAEKLRTVQGGLVGAR